MFFPAAMSDTTSLTFRLADYDFSDGMMTFESIGTNNVSVFSMQVPGFDPTSLSSTDPRFEWKDTIFASVACMSPLHDGLLTSDCDVSRICVHDLSGKSYFDINYDNIVTVPVDPLDTL